jgi:hypothetical protein
LGGERTSNTDADDEEPFTDDAESFTDVADSSELNSTCKPSKKSYTHSNQSEFHQEPERAVEPYRSLMHRTNSGLRTLIPCTGTVIPSTNSGSRAVISNQKGPSADSENDSEPRATKEPSADSENDSEPRAINSTGNAERIDPERDLQIASGLNGQQRPRRILRPTFKV